MDDFSNNSTFEISKLEITRNPFDSNLYEKENFPTFSPSILAKTDTPKSESGDFRWSIDQIATMNPTAIEEYPLQEYSVSYEHKEDEIKEQKEIDDYFASLTLPSPWLQKAQGSDVKRVTFSPHPPMTRIIQEANDSSLSSSNISEQTGVKGMVDACCQTTLSIPFSFDLETLLGNEFLSYQDDTAEDRELIVSSLRRKLFQQSDIDVIKSIADGMPVEKTPLKKSSVSSGTPNYITSSPFKEEREENISVLDSSNEFLDADEVFSPSPMKVCSDLDSPCASPIKAEPDMEIPDRSLNSSFASVDMSPIEGDERPPIERSEVSIGQKLFNQDVSYSFDDTTDDFIRESSRAAFRNFTPDVSPIREENAGEKGMAHRVHVPFTNLEFSSIDIDQTHDTNDARTEDGGPLDISDFDHEVDGILEDTGPCDISEFEDASQESPKNDNCESKVLQPKITPLKSILKRRPNDILVDISPEAQNSRGNPHSLPVTQDSSKVIPPAIPLGNSRPIPKFTSSFSQPKRNPLRTSGVGWASVNQRQVDDKENVLKPDTDKDKCDTLYWREIKDPTDGDVSISTATPYEDFVARKACLALNKAGIMQSTLDDDLLLTSEKGRSCSPPYSWTSSAPLNSTAASPLQNNKNVLNRECLDQSNSFSHDRTLSKIRNYRLDSNKRTGLRKPMLLTRTASPNLPLDLLSLRTQSPANVRQLSRRAMYRTKTWPHQIADRLMCSPSSTMSPRLSSRYKVHSRTPSHYPSLREDDKVDSLCHYDDALDCFKLHSY